MLTEENRRRLCKMSSLVKIVCLDVSFAAGRTRVLGQSVGVVGSQFRSGWHGSREPKQNVFTIETSRQVEEIIADMTAVLMK